MLLFGRATASIPDATVTLGLRWTGSPGRYSHFDRLDWRPVDAHNNRGVGPVDLRFRLIEGTHHHRLTLNAAAETRAIAGDGGKTSRSPNRCCQNPPTGKHSSAIAGERWRIRDLVNTPYPPWQYGLLPLTGGEARGGKSARG